MHVHPRVLLVLTVIFGPAMADTSTEMEEVGQDPVSATSGPSSTAFRQSLVPVLSVIGGSIPEDGILLIPESTNDRVMAFDPDTGELVDAGYIPSDPTNLSTPINAILSADAESILVSDQGLDVVQQYDLDGNYLGVFAPAGGVDIAILDNIRGMSLRANGNLLVTVGGGTNADAIAEFDTNGSFLGNFIAPGLGGLDSPFDVLVRATDILVGGVNSDALHRYTLDGAYVDDFATVDSFPEQLAEAGNGNVLVGNFAGTQEGVMEFSPDGSTLIDTYDPASLGGYRGVYELANGNLLTTNGSGVHEIDRSGNLVETKISVSARFIEYVEPIDKSSGSNGGGGGSGIGAAGPLALLLLAALAGTCLWNRGPGCRRQ